MASQMAPGIFVNPGDEAFARARCEDLFVDKSGLIDFTNHLLGKERNKICVTRPSGFGKSRAVDMLAAYYSRSCNAAPLFQDLKIAQSPAFLAHLNQYNVIRLRMKDIWEQAENEEDVSSPIRLLQQQVLQELLPLFPEAVSPQDTKLSVVLPNIHKRYPGTRFLFLIDDWDVPFRSSRTTAKRKLEYLSFLIGLFKGSDVEECIDLVYFTGVLPIIKYLEGAPDQSMLNNFEEYSLLMPDALAGYISFTESEVADLCVQRDMPLALLRAWYGYPLFGLGTVYCPASVVQALTCRDTNLDWGEFSASLEPRNYIKWDLPGLKEAVDALLAGNSVPVDSASFLNNPNSILFADDILTLLVHYGYLAYQPRDESAFALEPWKDGTVQIPNRAAYRAFQRLIASLPRDA